MKCSMMQTDPFPHMVIDHAWHPYTIEQAAREAASVPESAWHWFMGRHEYLKGQASSEHGGPCVQGMIERLSSPGWIELLESHFGIDGLSFDELGGGMHRTKPGGRLDVHVDFNRHPDGRYRRLNCITFLNDVDKSGSLWLCKPGWAVNGPTADYKPFAGRTVIFATSESSWHGHPWPLQGTTDRLSIAAYYYTTTPGPAVAAPHDTIYPDPDTYGAWGETLQ